jgi:hypothetical protein
MTQDDSLGLRTKEFKDSIARWSAHDGVHERTGHDN